MKYKITLYILLFSTRLLAYMPFEDSPSHQTPQNEFEELALILTKYGQNAEGLPPLYFAIIQNDRAAFELLIKYGASPFLKHGNKQFPPTCLYYAVKEGYLEFVERLIELGLDPINVPKGSDSDMLLNVAIRYRRNDVAKYLIDYGVQLFHNDREVDYLYTSIHLGNLEIFHILLNKGVTTNKIFRELYPTALASIPNINAYWTVPNDFQSNKIEMLLYFLERKLIDPNELFEERARLFIESKEYFDLQKELIRILLRYGADINHTDKKGNTPLKLAKDFRMREFLLSLGAKEK